MESGKSFEFGYQVGLDKPVSQGRKPISQDDESILNLAFILFYIVYQKDWLSESLFLDCPLHESSDQEPGHLK